MADDIPTTISRADARRAGLKHYFNNNPCKHGHLSGRRVSTGLCLECSRIFARNAGRRRRSSEMGRKLLSEIGKRCRERIKADPLRRAERKRKKYDYQRQYSGRPEIREANRVRARQRYKENPARDIARVHKRRSKFGAELFCQQDIDRIYRMQRGRCAYCRVVLQNKYEIDHIDPNGSNAPNNLQLTCARGRGARLVQCNQSKGNRDPIQFARQELGLLL